jgi:hypothetical protein
MSDLDEPQETPSSEPAKPARKPVKRSKPKAAEALEGQPLNSEAGLEDVTSSRVVKDSENAPEPETLDVLIEQPDEVANISSVESTSDSEAAVVAAPSKRRAKNSKALVEETEVTEPEVVRAPKRGFFAWLGGLFRSKKNQDQKIEGLDLNEVDKVVVPEGLLESDLDLSPYAIRKELTKERREVRELAESKERFEAEVTTKSEQMVVYAEQVERITAWANQVSRTFIWKVQEEMNKNLELAKSDMAMHEEAVKNLEVIEPGRLLKLRKSFHKSLTWALVVCGGLIAIASLIRFRDDIPRLDWLSVLYDPNISGPILIFVVAMFVGVMLLLSRRSEPDAPKLSRIIWFSLIAILVAWLIWESSRQGSFMQQYVNPFVDRHYAEILTALASIWGLWVITSLIAYYRGYSVFNREVESQILSLEGVIEGYVKTQQELSRLGLLYRQTNDWLEILANALYRPWKTHPEWGTSKEFTSHYDTFPFALRVAQAREGADASMQELERIIGLRLLTQGWRNDAFEDLVAQVGAEMGLPPGKFIVDLLDQDLPHQTNNSRALLKRFLIHSAKTSYLGQVDLGSNSVPPQTGKPDPTDRYLIEVARKRLLDLIEKTQSVAISAARPRVEQIVEDPLLSLRADSAGVDDFDPTESWDEFLTDSLGTDSVDETPLGVLSFTEEGRMKNWPSKVQSFVLVPKRLEKSLPHISSDRISVVPLGDDRPRSLEIIARIDVVGPADLNSVALLGESAQRKIQLGGNKPVAMEIEEEL